MNPTIQLKKATPIFVIAVLIACLGLSPKAQAVSPPPDGGYAHYTTAEGENALLHLTTGVGNTAVGALSLTNDTTGNYNVGIGVGALAFNNADSNTAVGTVALLLNTTGTQNTATGTDTLVFNSTGNGNTAFGAFALENNTANGNTAIGNAALIANTTGSNNQAMGVDALINNTVGSGNIAIGIDSMGHNVSGSANTVVGSTAGETIVTGNNNTYIGTDAGGPADESNTIRIGNATNVSCYIAGIVGAFNPADTVKIDPATGQLGDQPSSARFKKDIDPMDKTSEAIFSLRPVTFRYKNDKTNTPQFGLIAEEVAKVNPALIGVDKEGKPYCVQYDKVDAMLLNEFLKEHQKVQDLEKQVEKLTAGLQRASAQLEASKPAP